MHETNIADWEHTHSFGLERRRPGERRTLIVALLTAATMVVEIVAGIAFGSMALLADGLHMASHTVALGLALVAYIYCRRHAGDPRFTFGTGKVNSLGGYTSALLLAGFALYMVIESVSRLMTPVPIRVRCGDRRRRHRPDRERGVGVHPRRSAPRARTRRRRSTLTARKPPHTIAGTATAIVTGTATVTVMAMAMATVTDTRTTTCAAPTSTSSPMP